MYQSGQGSFRKLETARRSAAAAAARQLLLVGGGIEYVLLLYVECACMRAECCVLCAVRFVLCAVRCAVCCMLLYVLCSVVRHVPSQCLCLSLVTCACVRPLGRLSD